MSTLRQHDVDIYNPSDCILNYGRLYLREKADMEYPEREDLIFPGTSVYDADDHVVGCIDFSRV